MERTNLLKEKEESVEKEEKEEKEEEKIPNDAKSNDMENQSD